MQSSVSLVIPFYNRETLLPRTLKSVAESSLFPAHVVLVDNGSADGSLDVCRQWRAEHPDLRVTIVQETTPGAAAARNRGLQEVDTPWVYFFDSDDVFDPDILADLQPHLTETLDFVAVTTRQIVNGKAAVRHFRPTDDPACQILYSHLNTLSMVFRTDFLHGIGGWDARCRIWDDWELGIRALLAKPRMCWLTQKAYHRIDIQPNGITGSGFCDKSERLLRVLHIAADDIRGTVTDVAARRRLLKALYLRHSILAGRLLAEGDKAGVRMALQQRQEICGSAGAILRSEGWIITRLTACGLPGTWRLAMLFV